MSAGLYRPCVGIVLHNGQGGVFAGQRADMDTPAWQMPQGGIDPGETVEDAGFRELVEETGVGRDAVVLEAMTAKPLRYDFPADVLGKRFKEYVGQEQHWALMRSTDETAINIATAHPEFSDWAWFTPAEITAWIVPFKRPIYEAVFAEFASHLKELPR
ncbi:MAG: RNA pyrophosphohydrolase [Pseudomonadota bacterium]